jgi:voltage-gated potassium channel
VTSRKRIAYGLVILGVVFVVGTVGYVAIEGVSVIDAFYMVVITVTTVGFSEVFELSQLGRVWTVGIIGIGFGTALYTAVASFEYVIDLSEVRRRKSMENEVGALTNHIIVCGWGRVGRGTWKELIGKEQKAVVIESLPERAEAAEAAGALVIQGDATHNDVLELAGIHAAQSLIACVADDSDNLVIALSAKSLRPELRVVCRATEPESERKLLLAGADAVVVPQGVGSERLALMAIQPEVAQIFDVVVGGRPLEFHVEEMDIPEGCRVAGMTIRESRIRDETGAFILGIERQKERMVVNPRAEDLINVGDRIVVVGTKAQVARAADMLDPDRELSTGKPS